MSLREFQRTIAFCSLLFSPYIFSWPPQSSLWLWLPFLYAAAAAAKSLQLCLTLCDPIEAAHQAPPSLGFSRQEYWSELLFPSPMHESEKWKCSRSVVSNSYRPHGLQPSRLLHPWDFPGVSTEVGCHCLLYMNIPQLYIPSLDDYSLQL